MFALAIGLSCQALADNFQFAGDRESSAQDKRKEGLSMVRPLNFEVSTIGLKEWADAVPEPSEGEYENQKVWISTPLKYAFMPRLGGFDAGVSAHRPHTVPTE